MINDLATANVACAVGIVDFEEDVHMVFIGDRDMTKFETHEEAFLRELGVIADEQPFNGFIEENSRNESVDTSNSSAAPAPPTAKVCIMQHIESGGCSCTYRKKCFKVALPPPGPGNPTASSCGSGESFTAKVDHSVEMLLSPRALRTLILDPDKLCGTIDLAGRPFTGIIPLIDFNSLNMNAWHLQQWVHIIEGPCKCKYLPLSAKEVSVSHFKIRDAAS